MALPPLLHYESIKEYKMHYEQYYCRANITTFDDIRVYFQPQKFNHAFYENASHTKGPKDKFAPTRAQRMDWIKSTLEHPDAELFRGWNKHDKCYEVSRRVSVVYEAFVVVIAMNLSKQDGLKASFITCYVADKSIERIRQSPVWDKDTCLEKLRGRAKKRICR